MFTDWWQEKRDIIIERLLTVLITAALTVLMVTVGVFLATGLWVWLAL